MDSTQLVQIRKDFYLNIRKRVQSVLGAETAELKAYRNSYDKELARRKWQAIDKRHLFARLRSADIILVGDFHAHKQSTRGFLRIIRKVKSDFVIGLECLRVKDQEAVEHFLEGKTSEKDFLRQVAWKKHWSFPWENYKPLFKWAQQNKVKIYALNSDDVKKGLRERDRFSAKRIKEISQKNPKKKIFIQYGDLHLATMHLPKEISKVLPQADKCVIFQSPEMLYFKIMEKQKEITTDVVKLNHDLWALNGLPPWVKWQDYLLYLESGHDKKVRAQDIDPTDTVANSIEFLSKSFGIPISLGALSVYSANDDGFFDLLEKVPRPLKKRLIENIQEGISFYSPEMECGYLARYSMNHVLRIAAEYLYFQTGGFTKTILDAKKDFLKIIWLEAVVYFCSKVKNPKRKSDTLQDVRMALQKEQFDDRGKEALMLALNQKLSEMQFLSAGKYKVLSEQVLKKYSRRSIETAAQIIGGIMGEKIFAAFHKKMIRFPENKGLIFRNLQLDSFSRVYFESLEMIESWPETFKSKYDKL